MLAALPGWPKTWIGAAPDHAAAMREIREALLAWEKLGQREGEDFMPALLSVGRGLVLAEQALATGAEDVELSLALSRAYQILSNPGMASEHGAFQQILASMALQAEQSEGPKIDVAEAMRALREGLIAAADAATKPAKRRTKTTTATKRD